MASDVIVVAVTAVLLPCRLREDPSSFDKKPLEDLLLRGEVGGCCTTLADISAIGERAGLWSVGSEGRGLFLLRKGERKRALIGLVGCAWFSMVYR